MVYAQTLAKTLRSVTGHGGHIMAWLIGPALALVLLWHMGSLFRLFAAGHGLAPGVLHHVQVLGALAAVVYRLIMRPFERSWPFGPSKAQDSMSISFSSHDVMMGLGGFCCC